MSKDDKTVAAIVFGISFVIALKLTEVILSALPLATIPSNSPLTYLISGVVGAIVAFALVQKIFPGYSDKQDNEK